MSDTMRRFARRYAERIQAAERIVLRRWLRRNARDAEGNLPEHLYLTYDRDALWYEVEKFGGDPGSIVEQERNALIDKIKGGR